MAGLVRVCAAPGNAGIVAGWNCTNLGYEWKGDPGFFANSCS